MYQSSPGAAHAHQSGELVLVVLAVDQGDDRHHATHDGKRLPSAADVPIHGFVPPVNCRTSQATRAPRP